MRYRYQRVDEEGRLQFCPLNDYDGKITGTGLCIIGLKAWFDENPEERKRLGWIKHWEYEKPSEIAEDLPEYDPTKHYLAKWTVWVDEYTTKDKYYIIEKTDEMMAMEEMLEAMNLYVPTGTMLVDSMGGAIL